MFREYFLILSLLFALCFNSCNFDQHKGSDKPLWWDSSSDAQEERAIKSPDLTLYDGGFFSIKKPSHWQIITAGQCATFSFYTRDPKNSLNQVFFFGNVGPVYLSQQQKQIDMNYMRSNGFRIPHIEMPVIQPATPSNFLKKWNAIVATSIARRFMQPLPQLKKIQVISSQSVRAFSGGQSALVRAVFEKNGKAGEGLFLINLVPNVPFTGGPGGGTCYGLMVTGITAEKRLFALFKDTLNEMVKSFTVSQQYAQQCINVSQRRFGGIMKAGQTLRETSDMIIKGWENRNKIHDILAEKRSDVILEKERLYDTNTGEVFEFNLGFYDRYKLNPNRYNRPDLKLLPDNNYKLWTTGRLDGTRHVHLE